jgi:parallel beta-helix repeat protein
MRLAERFNENPNYSIGWGLFNYVLTQPKNKAVKKLLTSLLVCVCAYTQAQNKSLSFTATNNNTQLAGVSVADHSSLDFTAALTIEAWIKPTFSPHLPNIYQGTIVAKDNWAGNVNTGYVLRCGGAGVLDFTYGAGGTNAWQSFTSVNGVLNANVWQHVAVTFAQNGAVKMYVNGIQVSLSTTGLVNNAIATNAQNLGIGTDLHDAKLRNFNGQIDEVRLWNVERSAAQIKTFKDRTLCNQTGLVAYYQLNESSGNICTNSIASSAGNGTITTISSGTVTRQTTGIDLVAGSILYVKTGVTNGNGASWVSAYADLQDALTVARTCTAVNQIWVAAGTYYPTSGTDQTISFQLINNVAVYGGFVGTETQLSQRNWVNNPTILSGDIDKDNLLDAQNSYHVFYHYNNGIDASAVLNGFTLTGGYAYVDNANYHNSGGGMMNFAASPTIENCTFTGNKAYLGGGVYGVGTGNNYASPEFYNCHFWNNSAVGDGGAVYEDIGGSPKYTNCIFTGNSSLKHGGAVCNKDAGGYYTNCSISGNHSRRSGGGIYSYSSDLPTLRNCILWGNEAVSFVNNFEKQYGVEVHTTLVLFDFCIVQDVGGIPCGGCEPSLCFNCPNGGNVDPLFQNQPTATLGSTGDLRLKYASPAINAGTTDGSSTPTTDYLGNPRTGVLDIGAYEVVMAGVPNVYVDSSRAVSGAGHSWASAFKTLSEATDGAWAFPNIQKIYVAKGTYSPQSLPYLMETNQTGTAIVSTNNRDKTFHIRQGLEVYGGYPTGGGTQNIAANKSILDGKGVGGILADSAYHVVLIDSSAYWSVANDTTKLVGFTVRNGNANAYNSLILNGNFYTNSYEGAGIYIGQGINILKDNTIENNTALYKGGGVSLRYGNYIFTNNLVRNNKALAGGGVFCDRLTASFKNNIFYQNAIINDFYYFEDFETISGGGMTCYKSKSLIANNLFAENSSSKLGGGLALVYCFDTIQNNTFYKNKIDIFENNVSTGGGLLTVGGNARFYDPNYVSLKNNIFWKNMIVDDTTAKHSDAYLAVEDGTIENNIFQLDSLNANNEFNYAIVGEDDEEQQAPFPVPPFANNKYQKNPKFLNENNLLGTDNQFRTNDDGLQLTGCTPAINSGLSLNSLENTDITGSPRIVYNKTDIGAYEYAGTTGCTIMSIASGRWESVNTWNIGRIPFQKDNVILDNNHTVNITTNAATAKTLEYRLNSGLNFSNNFAKFNLGL